MPYTSRPQPNVQVGSGRIPVAHKHPKPHKSQPHAKPPRKSKAKNSQAWRNKAFVPGGITTRGQIADQRAAARRSQFSAQNDEIAQEQKAIPSWYEDYLKKLQGLQAQSTQAYTGLQSQAASLGESVLNQTPEGMKAQDARNNIVKAIQGALLQGQGANTNYNSQMGAIAGARKDQRLGDLATAKTKLAKAKGDFNTEFTGKARQTEFENSLAAQQFGLKAIDSETKRIAANKKPKPETTYDKEFAKQAAKYGFSSRDWEKMGSRGRAQRIAEAQKRSGQPVKSISRIQREESAKQAARHGYTIGQWNKLTAGQRSSIIRGPGKAGGKGGSKGKGKGHELDFAPATQQAKAQHDSSTTVQIAHKLRKKGYNRHKAAKALLADKNAVQPVLVSASLDAAYDGHLSRETARRLHVNQYKVTEIARALGTLTFTEWAREQTKKQRNFERNFTHKRKRHTPRGTPQPHGPGGQRVS